ncbi:FkbM family methyltransferase [Citrobacter koseri]|uniref:FkbM family methyltransferase n=1 Tax=Citrobacter koseri TaxID=545 RepID=UPI00106F614A|nr:FkbM family methyltransferase [Citrobacter koseri]MBJ8874244.1 FkbM family methyltransferase [Citrobacter koseri]MBJ9236240.1 FkbM family methyltransferase [Citrobacter koseri]VFS07504.1 methyltransferase, FkbM family [Citrobacter koseri]
MLTDEQIADFCHAFIEKASPRYIFGLTSYGIEMAKVFNVEGIIDNKTMQTQIDGFPIISLSQVPSDALIVSSIMDGRPVSAWRTLSAAGHKQIDYFSFYRYFSHLLSKPTWYHQPEFVRDYAENREAYERIRALLADDISKRTFDDIINFRLTNKLQFLAQYNICLNDQYFDLPFIGEYAEHFIDCGSFDGATSVEFMRRFPSYNTVCIFEPEPRQAQSIQQAMQGRENVYVYPCGVSHSQQKLSFSSSGSTSHASEDGGIDVEMVALDDVLKGRVTFIKMDIEGFESQALEGAKRIIRQQHPLLAVCCYHKPDDFRTLPEQVLGYREDYDIYLRHYTEGLLETVYYFVPRKGAQ